MLNIYLMIGDLPGTVLNVMLYSYDCIWTTLIFQETFDGYVTETEITMEQTCKASFHCRGVPPMLYTMSIHHQAQIIMVSDSFHRFLLLQSLLFDQISRNLRDSSIVSEFSVEVVKTCHKTTLSMFHNFF